MISFWVHGDGAFGLRHYCEHRGLPIASRFEGRLYDEVGEHVQLAGGTQLFSALDQLSGPQRDVVATLWDAHAKSAPESLRLNDPRRVLLRRDLLQRLHQEGINTFRAFHAENLAGLDRFPVFVRCANDHSGPRTGLLHSRREVARAVRGLRVRGCRVRDLLVVEFCNTAGQDGCVRKYAAYKVGDAIVPCHVLVAHAWTVKAQQHEPTEERIRECLAFLDENPHETWLRRVFDIAGVDYGRIDYGILDGVPQVWEINLNPTIGRGAGQPPRRVLAPDLERLREHERETFHERLRAAFVAVDRPGAGPSTEVRLDPALLGRVQAERVRRDRRKRAIAWLQRLYDTPRFGRSMRALGARLAPRA